MYERMQQTGLFADTTREAERVLIDLIRRAPTWRRLEMLNQMALACRELALCGLRQRFPNSTETELRRRLAALLLGSQIAKRVYGWDHQMDGL